MKLILIRHGETNENVGHTFPDVLLGNLNAKGILQATELGKKLIGKQVDAIFCSPADRCRQTLELILAQTEWKTKAEFTPEIQERNYGKYIGTPTSGINRETRDGDSEENLKMGMEKHADVDKRIKKFLENLKNNFKDKEVVMLVSHGDPMMWMCANIKGISYSEAKGTIKINNAEALEFEI
jgi:broad specificity phosphatase PhoE